MELMFLGHKLGVGEAPIQIPSSRVRMLPFEETNFYLVYFKIEIPIFVNNV